MGEAISVLLVDDHEMARAGLRRLLDMEPDIQVVGEASDGQEVVSKVQSLSPDVILMDVKMPKVSGIDATRLIKRSGLGGKVIVLSFIEEYLAQAIEAGADGYLTKDVGRDELVKAIRRVNQGDLVLGTSLMSNPEVGEHIVKRLQEMAWPNVTGGTAQVPLGERLGSIADPQRAPGNTPAEEEVEKVRSGDVLWDGRAPDGTTTILFSDIQGSSAMIEKLGDYRAQEILRAHNSIIRDQLSSYGGFEVKSMGDGFMVAFSSARLGLQCAISIQRAFSSYNDEHTDEPVRVRIGLHTGETVREADDFFGRNVILASRITKQAKGGQILVSSLLMELTQSAGDIRFGQGREVELMGLVGVNRVFEVRWQEA